MTNVLTGKVKYQIHSILLSSFGRIDEHQRFTRQASLSRTVAIPFLFPFLGANPFAVFPDLISEQPSPIGGGREQRPCFNEAPSVAVIEVVGLMGLPSG